MFLLTGALVGVLVALVLAFGPGSGARDQGALLGYLVAMLAGLGALAGGAVAVVLESRRR